MLLLCCESGGEPRLARFESHSGVPGTRKVAGSLLAAPGAAIL
jgi:hypothetical protein